MEPNFHNIADDLTFSEGGGEPSLSEKLHEMYGEVATLLGTIIKRIEDQLFLDMWATDVRH